ncbi:MAG TPA: response regulator [Pyrinomonadaceae bacterium]|nr:response regulator [Pyrinomonadaceae bacterium]
MRPRILFVEDHDDTRFMIRLLLDKRGYQVETAESANQGLKLAQNEAFDLFLLDYQLGDGNGKELCEKIRKFDSDTPILFFSASHPKIQQDAVECGAQGFVLKPDIDALHGEIERALAHA